MLKRYISTQGGTNDFPVWEVLFCFECSFLFGQLQCRCETCLNLFFLATGKNFGNLAIIIYLKKSRFAHSVISTGTLWIDNK